MKLNIYDDSFSLRAFSDNSKDMSNGMSIFLMPRSAQDIIQHLYGRTSVEQVLQRLRLHPI